MDSGELCQSSIGKLADLIKRREITVSDVVKAVLHRIQTVNPRINAYITVLSDEAVEVSRELDDVIRRGKHRGMLHGVPFAAKDIFATRGVLTSAASKILVENIPDHDATSVARLREEGAVLIGKQNLHEFAYGPTSEESHYGPCRNPWNTEMVSGGSSGGSAAAVAAGICHGALGSDTGGSIRIPASLCGVVGLKPTYGRISRYGVIPLSWSLDHVGVITRTVEDAALMLETVSGKDPHDPTCSNRPTPKLAPHLSEDVTGIKAAVLKQFMDECVDAKVRKAVETAIGAVEKLGVEVEEITVPNVEHTAGVTNMLMACEATSVHEEWLKTRVNEYQPSVSTRLQVGYFYTSMHYIKALKVREWFRREFARIFKRLDVLLSPTCPIAAFKVGQKTLDVDGRSVDPRPYLPMFTRVHNLTGFPALSVPCGFTEAGLPVGLQISGRAFDEKTVLNVAYAYEQSQPWKDKRPNITA